MLLSRFPRVRLAHLPTPLEHLPRLSEHLGGPQIYVKRDDCTGLGTGGNKTRKLEFLMADAQEKGADTIITQGATQFAILTTSENLPAQGIYSFLGLRPVEHYHYRVKPQSRG